MKVIGFVLLFLCSYFIKNLYSMKLLLAVDGSEPSWKALEFAQKNLIRRDDVVTILV